MVEISEFLGARLVGQERAVRKIAEAYDDYNSPLWEPAGPISCFLFAGPSGSGKTHIVELLAEYFYGDRKAFTKISCGKYKQQHQLSQLIGAPPGYVGYNDPKLKGQKEYGRAPLLSQENIDKAGKKLAENNIILTDPAVVELNREIARLYDNFKKAKDGRDELLKRLNGKINERDVHIKSKVEGAPVISIILFDEIEKAHQSLYDFLLEIMDSGTTRMDNGDETCFYRSFIFMTSNVGSRSIADVLIGKTKIGVRPPPKEEKDSNVIFERTISDLRDYFSPEFLGRVEEDDGIVVFRPLSRDNMLKIFDLNISYLYKLLEKKFPLNIIIERGAKEFVLDKSLDHREYGSRLLKSKIVKYIKRPLVRAIKTGKIQKGDVVFINLESGKLVFKNFRGEIIAAK